MKNKATSSKKQYKKKALKATWDSDTESDEDVDVAYVAQIRVSNTIRTRIRDTTKFKKNLGTW